MIKSSKLTKNKVLLVNLISVVLLIFIVGIFFLTKPKDFNPINEFIYGSEDFNYGVSKIGVLDSTIVDRPKVLSVDGGLSQYPSLENPIDTDLELKEAILSENIEMMDFDSIDESGNLYSKNIKTGKQLIKHSAADTQYQGEVSSDALAYKKTLLIDPYEIGNSMTGLYVPAGELVKVELPKEYIDKGITAEIGRIGSRGYVNNIPIDRSFTRMPNIVNKLSLNKEVNYIGNPLGGPLYLNLNNINSPIEVTITGAIEYPHFILGTTSKTELDRLLVESEGLTFDLEIPGIIRLTMPKTQIDGLSADELIEAAIYWEKYGSLSNHINQGNWYRTHLITHIYDSFVPAGAAVAFVGASFSILPTSWARGVLDINEVVNNGSWGNYHEFNHHHQSGIGASNGVEVTNNVINILSYMNYSNISSSRSINKDIGNSWNRHLDPSFSLKKVNEDIGTNTSLEMYVPLINSFGVEKFVEAFKIPTKGNDSNFFRNFIDTLGFDMTYYMYELNELDLTKEDLDYAKSKNYPMYIPTSTVYQVGQVQDIYNSLINEYDTKIIKTAQPYVIDVNEEVNISDSIVVPNNFNYRITNTTNPTHGKVSNINGNYIYTPTSKNEYDEFKVTIQLTNGTYYSEQTLVLGFGIQTNRAKNELTTNIYSNQDKLVTLDNPLDYNKLTKKDSKTTNNGNVTYNGSNDDVMVTTGQILMPESKKYTFYIAADDYAIMYVGHDRDNLKEVARTDSYLANYSKDREGSYFTIDLIENKSLFFKLVVINKDGQMGSKIGYDTGSTIKDIPNEMIYAFENEITYKDYFKPLGNFEYRFTPNVNVIEDVDYIDTLVTTSENIISHNEDYKLSSIVDGNNYNGFHSSLGSTNFPGHFILEFNEIKTFNTVELYSLRNEGNPRALPKDIIIYISGDGINYMKVYNGVTKHTNLNIIQLDKSYSAKFLKLEVFTSHRENYIGIGEIKISNSFSDGNIFNASNSGTTINNKFDIVTNGAYLNGYALETKNGTLKFTFKGKNIALYSTLGKEYGIMKVRVNGGKWTNIDLSNDETIYGSLAYANFNLDDKENQIEVRSNKKDLINIDFFIAKDIVTVTPKSYFNFKLVLLITIPILIINISLITIYLVKRKKNNNSK